MRAIAICALVASVACDSGVPSGSVTHRHHAIVPVSTSAAPSSERS
jgi:hypothetical protein